MANKILITLSLLGAIFLATGIVSVIAHSFKTSIEVPDHVLKAYSLWKQKYNKFYTSESNEGFRLNLFNQSYKLVEETNNNPKFTYKLSLNKFADVSNEEFKKHYLATTTSEKSLLESQKSVTILPMTNIDPLNGSIDWVEKGAVTSVKDQGDCGSCWAFSAVGATEGLYAQVRGKTEDFSPQMLVDCDRGGIFSPQHGCNGGLMGPAMDYIQSNGIATLKNYPYKAVTSGCLFHDYPDNFKIGNRVSVAHDENDQLVAAVDKIPVSVGIVADAIRLYEKGVYNNWACGTLINHGVLAVGYGKDQESGMMYWKVKNSWGSSWGEKGYIRFERKTGFGEGICMITQMANYATN